MAPHDWTSEGMRYGDLHDVSSIDAKHERSVTGNVPCKETDPEHRQCSREFDWSSMCDAMPYWKGQEMKRSYFSCISYVDYMIGELVAELKTVQLYEDTTVVFWTGTCPAHPPWCAAHPLPINLTRALLCHRPRVQAGRALRLVQA